MSDLDHGGHTRVFATLAGRTPGDILDFSVNVNALGPPPWLRGVVSAGVSGLSRYPDPEYLDFRQAAGGYFGVSPDMILPGNGASDLLYALARASGLDRAVIPGPSFSEYARACRAAGMETAELATSDESGFTPDPEAIAAACAKPALVILGRPNNPAGGILDHTQIRDLAASLPRCLFLVDEAFGWFVPDFVSLAGRAPDNAVILGSLTKILAIPGLRLGFTLAAPPLLERLRAVTPPWSVNSLALAVGTRAFGNPAFFRKSAAAISHLRQDMLNELASLPGLTLFPAVANFVLCRLDTDRIDAHGLFSALLGRGIAIRVCANFTGLTARYFRVAVKSEEENRILLNALDEVLGTRPGPKPVSPKPKTPAVMFQGTSSNAGKSLLAAAFCRILLQDGFDPAPFKAQNMALNSGITRAGHEMGRAQILQAQACRLEADARMNPVLLKPCSDTGSQVIVMGAPTGNMDASAYAAHKASLWDTVCQAYDGLAREHRVMVLEGAGSPAEINLKTHDIVNMRMAAYAEATVLLAGDIDRGGVFAGLAGTMELLEEWERRLVRGFILNKFRGDPKLLGNGPDVLRDVTDVPVLGVIPFIHDLGLPEEDSVTFRESGFTRKLSTELDIAVIDLVHISNFTDFDALSLEPDVGLRLTRAPGDLDRPDAIIIPGSKNVPSDLEKLAASGLGRAIAAAAANGTEIAGVCAGMQILGRSVHDPTGLESPGRATTSGLGLLPVVTELKSEKTLGRVSATHVSSGLMLTGYEIHHGQTTPVQDGVSPAVVRCDGQVIGYADASGLVWGSYLHGIFDADPFRRWWLNRLRGRKGLPPLGPQASYDLEPALDRLAGVVRANLDVGAIYRMLGLD